jgi:ATP-dependent Clp protease ATP-binding subunit ClpC
LLETDGTAAQVLTSFGVFHAQVRSAVVRMMGLGVEAPEGEVALTGRAQDVIDRARREASIRDQRLAGTEHILLGLVRQSDGAAIRILLELDADPAAIRAALAAE